MSDKTGWCILALIALAFLWHFWSASPVTYPPGILVPAGPEQVMLSTRQETLYKGKALETVADFHLKARVLGKANYWFDRSAEVSPMDLCVGWGVMSDQKILDRMKFDQRHRWCYWQADKLPATIPMINSNMTNIHVIPANGGIKNTVDSLRPGELVEIHGFLVNVRYPDGVWKTSTVRGDTGDGACEILWVQDVRRL